MTPEEFDRRKDEPCHVCGAPVRTERNEHNAERILCSNTLCKQRLRPWGFVDAVKHSTQKRRKQYPLDQGVYEVWERFGNVCVVCSLPQSALIVLRIALHRHHPAEYSKTEHRGPILPVCQACHDFVTLRQREAWNWYRRVQQFNAESVSPSGSDVPQFGLSPDPLRPAGEASAGAVEGLPDDDADE